jgi:hypothetical protein
MGEHKTNIDERATPLCCHLQQWLTDSLSFRQNTTTKVFSSRHDSASKPVRTLDKSEAAARILPQGSQK